MSGRPEGQVTVADGISVWTCFTPKSVAGALSRVNMETLEQRTFSDESHPCEPEIILPDFCS